MTTSITIESTHIQTRRIQIKIQVTLLLLLLTTIVWSQDLKDRIEGNDYKLIYSESIGKTIELEKVE